jgi:hypothetical protein
MQYLHIGISYCILWCFHPIIPTSTSQYFHWFFWLTMQYMYMGFEMSTALLIDYVIFAYLHVFSLQNLFICKYYMCHV